MLEIESEGYEAYTKYLALQMHFKNPKYDFFRYKGRVNTSFDAFKKRNDRYKFISLERKYPGDELTKFLVSCFMHNPKAWVGKLLGREFEIAHSERTKRTEGLSYFLKHELNVLFDWLLDNDLKFNDLFVCGDQQYPHIIHALVSEDIHKETFLVFEAVFPNMVQKLEAQFFDPVMWPSVKRDLDKYRGFVKIDTAACKKILLAKIEEYSV